MRALASIFAVALTASPAAAAADRIDLAFQADPTLQAEPASLRTEQASLIAVRSVIERQIEAVRKEDANSAFAVVAPKLKQQFASSKAYLSVIKAQFPALANARLLSFGDLRETSYGTAQLVTISDKSGEPWLAFFLMDKDKGGDWRIGNVVMVKMPSTQV